MNPDRIRFGVLGAGRIGKIHAANLAGAIHGAELAALSDVDPAALSAVAAQCRVERTFADYRRVLELPDIDAVAICAPTNQHAPMILEAAAAGKAIFCEKPIDLSLEKILRVERAIQEHGVPFMVAFNRRFDPNFLAVWEAVRAGKVGEPHLLRITSRDPAPPPENYVRASGGIFLDMTIHDFDMARYLIGSEVTEIYARADVRVDPLFERAGDWDTALVTLTFANRVLGAIDNSRKAVYGYDQRVEVFGSEGMMTVRNNTVDNHIYCDRAGSHSAPPLNFFMERYAESYRKEMQAFVDSIRKGQESPVNARDGLMAVVLGLAAAQSVREDRPVQIAEFYERNVAQCQPG